MENKLHYIPVVPMRGVMVFPNINLNFDAGRDISIKGLASASEENSMVFLVAQRDIKTEKPKLEDLYHIGTIAKINQVMHLPGNITRVVVTGIKRGVIRELTSSKPFIKAVVEEFDDVIEQDNIINEAYIRRVRKAYEEYFAINSKLGADGFMALMSTNNLSKACDMIAGGVDFSFEKKQELLEEFDVYERAEKLIKALGEQVEILKLEQKISKKVKQNIDQNQKEYYLREQLKVISEELGDKDGINEEVKEFTEKIKKARMGKANTEKLLREVNRFAKMQPSSAESSVLRSYIETVLEMPWNKSTKENFDISEAQKILDEDHYGLLKVKERILEYLAVRQLTKGKNGTILCLSGPPGVGKTSVAKSVARALGRKYVRISLGGIHDEADIRGHRKTYIGAMEGRIMSAMKDVKVNNPLVLLDEIDKMGVDYKGDPSAALLEVLDVEQNGSFRDHYLEVEFDLSKVLFITTANTLDTVSKPLLDRMEVIELTGYTDEEKFHIAKDYLVKKGLDKAGLNEKQAAITDDAIRAIIEHYTREAGVRKLEGQINALFRRIAKILLDTGKKSVRITSKNISDYLGKERYNFDMKNEKDEVGIARGLAWTSVGGDTLSIETNVMSGSGKVELTGKLGDVMKESAMAAISYIRSRADELNIPCDFYSENDIHIHVPEGAVPKDGPSAGITMATALVSSLTGKPVRNDIAMTGEITLRGRVLPIGGLKEKSLAAYRAGITTVIIPEKNKADIDDVPQEIRKKMKFIPVSHMDTVLENALR